jgi:hypothetical protein
MIATVAPGPVSQVTPLSSEFQTNREQDQEQNASEYGMVILPERTPFIFL